MNRDRCVEIEAIAFGVDIAVVLDANRAGDAETGVGETSLAPASKSWRSLARILLVDPEAAVVARLGTALLELGYEVFAAEDGAAAEAVTRAEDLDLALVASRLGSDSGLDLIERLRALDKKAAARALGVSLKTLYTHLESMRLRERLPS